MLYKLLSHLSENTNFQHSVISLTGLGVYGPQLIRMGTPVYCLHMKGGRPGLRNLTNLYRLLKESRPCVLQTWLYNADFLGLIVGRLARVPRIVWDLRCSNMDFRHYAPTARWLFALLSRLSHIPDGVVVNSEAGRQFHSRMGYNPRRWEVIPNGFEIERYKPDIETRSRFRLSLGLNENTPIIGMIARYDPMKDHDNFLHAAFLFLKSYKNVHFALVGRGVDHNNSELARAIRMSGIKKAFIYLGNGMIFLILWHH